jgi:hypothetical protein
MPIKDLPVCLRGLFLFVFACLFVFGFEIGCHDVTQAGLELAM